MKKSFSLNKKQLIVLIIAIFTLIAIFSFSLFDGDSSRQMSDGFDSGVGQVVRKVLSVFVGEKRSQELNIRKLGHFFEYSVLGFEASLFVILLGGSNAINAVCMLFFGMASALIDETIQLGRAGRSGQISDVWLDLCGFTLCAVLTLTVNAFVRSSKRRKSDKANKRA